MRRDELESALPPDRPVQRDPIYRAVMLFWSLTPLYALFTPWNPVFLGLLASAMGLVLMPLMSVALLRLTNDTDGIAPKRRTI